MLLMTANVNLCHGLVLSGNYALLKLMLTKITDTLLYNQEQLNIL